MKKAKALTALILVLLLLATPFSVFAQSSIDTEIEYYDDGDYMVIETETPEISLLSNTVSKTKTATYYDNGNKQFRVKLIATFSYTGSSASCTSAQVIYDIYDSSWKCSTAQASRSGKKATGDFVMKKYVLGVKVKTVSKTLTLSCTNSGTVS